MKLFDKTITLARFAAVLSVVNTLCFHLPFFRHVIGQLPDGGMAVVIFASLALLMPVANYFAFYLVMWLLRGVGKGLLCFFFIANAVTLYFINTYDVMIDDTMMGNVFNTNYAEASGYWSWDALLYILILGVLPSVYIIVRKVDYGKANKFFANLGVSLGILLVIIFGNIQSWPWIDKNATVMGSLLMPWSYVVNTFRYQAHQRERGRVETLLPDIESMDSTRSVFVLIIGESARRDHFSLYGYGRETNPLLSREPRLKAYPANSSATYTTEGVKAMLDARETSKLYEPLPNYLFRGGVDVIWRSNNWGEPPLHIDKYQKLSEIVEAFSLEGTQYDEALLTGLADVITSSDKRKVAIFIHTTTSHGPEYFSRYPADFERFTPATRSVEMSSVPQDELFNAYDNTILYTDYIVEKAISIVRDLPGWRSCVMFVSDHGESLGENKLYMHGVPVAIAPREQYEIPFIVWTSEGSEECREMPLLTQHSVFHSALRFLGIKSPVYEREMGVFE